MVLRVKWYSMYHNTAPKLVLSYLTNNAPMKIYELKFNGNGNYLICEITTIGSGEHFKKAYELLDL